MSELRQDPITDRWVVIAENRAERPQEFARLEVRRDSADCPFCAGHESETPTAVDLSKDFPGANGTDWQLRVVPNKYPAVGLPTSEDEIGEYAPLYAASGDGLGQRQPGFGVHEVIIESPHHLISFSELTEPQAELVFLAYRHRLLALQSKSQVEYALIFKNARADAGASIEHVHSQLIALPWIPHEIQYELTKAHEHLLMRGESLMEAVLAAEVADGRRIVTSTDRFTVFCPAASRLPYETWVVPRQAAPRFELESPEVIAEAAQLVRDVIIRLESVIDQPAYNFWIHSAPLRDDSGQIHWRIEIASRLTRLAGFEIGSGCFINSVAPEEAAVRLRQETSE
jgi:UDPglucose--hexose-1-phosphate uridylyltransferase